MPLRMLSIFKATRHDFRTLILLKYYCLFRYYVQNEQQYEVELHFRGEKFQNAKTGEKIKKMQKLIGLWKRRLIHRRYSAYTKSTKSGIGNNYNAVYSDLQRAIHSYSYSCQEPIKWSLHLPYKPLESTLSCSCLLSGVGLHRADKPPSPDLKSEALTTWPADLAPIICVRPDFAPTFRCLGGNVLRSSKIYELYKNCVEHKHKYVERF